MTEKRQLFSGNEAIARGAYEAGVVVASAYPGTPSTEIMQSLSRYPGVYTEWAPNEKVALEVALGASFAGGRALAAMKHVGLNVAADPLFTAAYTGVRGGLVIVTADDPEMHSSQNEQDNRNYAFAAKLPMLEPADPAEALEFTRLAFALSEEFDTPVLLRSTTRLSHGEGLLNLGERQLGPIAVGLVKNPEKFVMLPANARKRRVELAARMERLSRFAESSPINRIEWGKKERGFITSGISYLYIKEAFPEASVLKLGMVYPLPEGLIKAFAAEVEELFVVEELDPFIELRVKALGISCRGKDVIPSRGELDTYKLKKALGEEEGTALFEPAAIPARPPNFCPGCPHRGVFYALSKLHVFVSGDIGCYTMAAQKPLSSLDTCVCMGAGISGALGMEKALGKEGLGKVVAVIGDSTFLHSGITGLIDIVHNRGCITVIILDNRTTAMTGHQPTAATGVTIHGESSPALDLEALCRAVGVKHVYKVDPHAIEATQKILKREIKRPEPSVVIAEAPCVLLPEVMSKERTPYHVEVENCQGCGACLKIGCPAMEWVARAKGSSAMAKKRNGHALIVSSVCAGCGQCTYLCKSEAITREAGHARQR